MPRPKKIPIICPFAATFEQDFRDFLATDIMVFGDIARDYCLWAGACEVPSPEGQLFTQKAALPGPYIIPASHWLWAVMKTNRRVKPMVKPPTNVMIEMAPSQTRSIRYSRDFRWKDDSLPSFVDWMTQLLERPQAAVPAANTPAAPVEAGFDAIIAALVDELLEAVVQAAVIPAPIIAPVVEVEEAHDIINLDEYLEDEPIEDVVADVQEGDVPFDQDEAMEEVVEAEMVMDIGQPDDVGQDEDVLVEEEVAEIGNVELPVQQVVVQPVEALLAPEVAQPIQRRRQPPRKAKQASRKAKQAPKKAPKKAPAKRRRHRVPKAQPEPTVQQRARGRGFVAKLMSDNTIRISGTIANVDWKASSMFKAAHDVEVVLRAPPRARFTKVAAGHSHIMMLTSQHHVYIIGSNKFGQLGSSLRRSKLTRAAAQTPGAIFRPLYGMVGLKVKRIRAEGHESWAYVGEEQTPYCCGVASDHTWRSSIMESHAVLMRRMPEQGQ